MLVADHIPDEMEQVFFGCKTSVIRSHAKSLFLDVEGMLNNHPAPVINDISCDTMEHFTLHIHAHLNIFINGEGYSIPSNVGIIPNQCIYWLHTHDDTGIIHIESPENRTFILGEFFDIWGENLSNNQI